MRRLWVFAAIGIAAILAMPCAIAGKGGGPEMRKATELTVNGIWSAPENNGVDLDGLCLLTRPERIDDW